MNVEEFREKAKDPEYCPGWDAIDYAFAKQYPDQEPHHYATNLEKRAALGGDQFLDGFSIYQSNHDYKHIVTYGMSELYADEEALGGEFSRWGYEMTMKLKASSDEECEWALSFLGNLARYTYVKESWFEPGHYMANANQQSLKLGSDSKITGFIVVEDTEVAGLDTIYGRVDFLQMVGITSEEYNMIHEDYSKLADLIEAMKKDNPYLVTDMNRTKSYIF